MHVVFSWPLQGLHQIDTNNSYLFKLPDGFQIKASSHLNESRKEINHPCQTKHLKIINCAATDKTRPNRNQPRPGSTISLLVSCHKEWNDSYIYSGCI